jgi:Protein of unknown function (DUF3037)
MAQLYRCEFTKIFWMPNLERAERIVAGVMLFAEEIGFAKVEFTRDYRRLRCFDPAADPDLFEALEKEFASRVSDAAARAWFLAKVPDWASNALQLSTPTAVLSADPATEFESMVKRYLVTERLEVAHGSGERERDRIRRKMVEEFKRYDVWNLMSKRIAMRDYVSTGQLTIDCGYATMPSVEHVQRTFRMFHALNLADGKESLSELVDTYPAFSSALRERMNAEPLLMAVTSDYTGEHREAAYQQLNEAGIVSATLRDVPMIAARARLELGLRPM